MSRAITTANGRPAEATAKVVVIGAGPAGLAAAKQLLEEGLEPVVLEASAEVGGQWNPGNPRSAVWPGMRTNTSRTTTAFSDFPPAPGPAMFPRADEVLAYLREYAEHFDVRVRVRTGAWVERVSRAGSGWRVRWSEEGVAREESFAGVVVASGRFGRPHLPEVPGLDAVAREGRVLHSSAYRGNDPFRGRRVLVYGNSISGVEIASALAADNTITVISAARAPRYVIQKVVRGMPTDWRWFNRLFALRAMALAPPELAAGWRDAVLAEAGDPSRYGGLAVDPAAPPKLSQSQEYLAYVAEGRIAARPAVASVEGDFVRFADGTQAEVDVVIFATGYELDLPYLDEEVRRVVGGDDGHLDLHARTFHPELDGLAFIGQYHLIGPHFPTFELQARWIAAVWSGAVPAPSENRMRAGIAEHRAMRRMAPSDIYPALAALLAGELDVEPDVASYPELAEGLIFGPLAAARYRLQGHGAKPEAEALLHAALTDFGPYPPAPGEQLEALCEIADALGDPSLAEAVERLRPAATVCA